MKDRNCLRYGTICPTVSSQEYTENDTEDLLLRWRLRAPNDTVTQLRGTGSILYSILTSIEVRRCDELKTMVQE